MDPLSLATPEGAARLTCFYYLGCGDAYSVTCPDGFAGAWALYRQLPANVQQALSSLCAVDRRDPESRVNELLRATESVRAGLPVFLSIDHGDAPPPDELVAGRNVVYVGHTPELSTLEWVAALARSTTVLDHHRGAKELKADPRVCAVRVCAVHDPGRSSAQIAWDWATEGAPRPPVIDYIGEGVMHGSSLQNSRAVYKAIHVEGVARSFAGLSAFATEDVSKLAARGSYYDAYEAYTQAGFMRGAALRAAVRAHLPGEESARTYRVLFIKACRHRQLLSEALVGLEPDDIDFIVVWSLGLCQDNIWACAATSRAGIDLSTIVPNIVGATHGEGQPKSASFRVASDRIDAVATPL
jgi:hypothetical protein